MRHLASRHFFDEKVTAEMVRAHLEALAEGMEESVLVTTVDSMRTPGVVSDVQVLAMLGWASEKRGLTYAESVARLVHCPRVLAGRQRPSRSSSPAKRSGSAGPKGKAPIRRR